MTRGRVHPAYWWGRRAAARVAGRTPRALRNGGVAGLRGLADALTAVDFDIRLSIEVLERNRP